MSPEELRDFAQEHVGYAVDMMVNSAEALRRPTGAWVVDNALVESFTIHARELDDFLRNRRGRDGDDVTAEDYLKTWAPRRVLSKEERDIVNKLVAHLTEQRLDPKTAVQVTAMTDGVLVGLDAFLLAVPPDERGWFARVRWAIARHRSNRAAGEVTGTTSSGGPF
jgi:hypothetical protein